MTGNPAEAFPRPSGPWQVMQAGMLIRLDVERQVLYNKAIPSFSMLDLYVSDFSVAPKVGHIQRLAQNDYL